MSSTEPGVTVDAILRHFRALLRQATLWQAPDILGLDVTMSQAKCLFAVALRPDVPMSALAERLGVGPPAASGLVDRLVEHGYLQRREDPDDRRQQLVSLTEAGTAVTERFRRFSAARLAELLDGLSRSEREALLLGLSALEREAARTAGIDPAPTAERTPA